MKCANEKKGISLLVLIITIIVMIILSSAVIITLNNSGIINKANEAVDNTQIAMEKQVVEQASMLAKSLNKTETPTAEQIRVCINEVVNEGTVTVIDDVETILIKFNDSNRYYAIVNNGVIEGPNKLIKDEYAGDITKGGAYDGSSDKPFKISCIEDLVAFSIMANGGNTSLGLTSNQFEGQYVELTKTLDFKSRFSYSDYTTTVYGDINKDGIVEDIRTELTKTDEGCRGFNRIDNFQGEFNGNTEEIINIYMNTTTTNYGTGLFYEIKNATIKNLGVAGEMNSGAYAGGITIWAGGTSKIINCYTNVNIVAQDGTTAEYGTGGICGIFEGELIYNCYNLGDVEGNSHVGGIAGTLIGTIENCYNEGKITSNATINNKTAGGIVGLNKKTGDIIIKNCYNNGQVYSLENGASGGILGTSVTTTNLTLKIINCYNNGWINSENIAGGIVGKLGPASSGGALGAEMLNCYNMGYIDSKSICGGIVGRIYFNDKENIKLDIHNTLNLGQIKQDAQYFGEVLGYSLGKVSPVISNCFYSADTSNKGVGIGNVTGETTATSIDSTLIITLNEYVASYNETNKNNEDFVELKLWNLDGQKVKFE